MNTVYIGNLPFDTTVEEITEELVHPHVPKRISIPKNESGRPKGFAFVEFETEAAAAAVVKELDGDKFGGRTLKASIAKPKAEGRRRRPMRRREERE